MQEEKVATTQVKKKKRKKKQNFLYLYLFAFVFIVALAGFSYLVKSYSPDIDVTIGNNDSITLSDSDMDVEIKSVDERLKWIQMEDEMPTVAIRDSKKQEASMNIDFLPSLDEENIESELRRQEEKAKKIIPSPKPPTPTIKDIQTSKPDFRTVVSNVAPSNSYSAGPIPLPSKPQALPVVPLPSSMVTKVYMGSYSSIEEAMAVQQEITSRDSSISPFIKATNGTYVVQLGSFSDKDKAYALVNKLRTMGFYPKVNTIH